MSLLPDTHPFRLSQGPLSGSKRKAVLLRRLREELVAEGEYLDLPRDKRSDVHLLDRMDDLVLLPKTFQRPANFKMGESRSGQQRSILVVALFDKEVARWVRESRSYYTVSEEETHEGLLVTLMPRQESEILQWLLSWGSHVRVLEPESLRKRIAGEAQAMLQNHQEG